LGVVLSDSFRDDYDHVWVTVTQIDLVEANGTVVTVYNDTDGKQIDVRTLHDTAGPRFAALVTDSVPSGNYVSAKVHVKPQTILYPKGADNGGTTTLDDALARDTNGNVILTFNLTAPRNLGAGNESLVVDFDLPNFTLSGGKLRPAVKEGAHTGLNDLARHEPNDFKGTISELSQPLVAGGYTFTLTLRSGQTLNVGTNTNTHIFNISKQPNPILANGKKVEVGGRLNTTTGQLEAQVIRIEDEAQENSAAAKGTALNLNTMSNSFDMLVARARGFRVTTKVIRIATTEQTVFRSETGLLLTPAEFMDRLSRANGVEAEGSFDEGVNALTAKYVRLEKEPVVVDGRLAEAKGRGINTDPIVGETNFGLNPVTEYEGFVYNGQPLLVTTTGITEFKDINNQMISSDAFYGIIAGGANVKVEGAINNNHFSARKVRIIP
jgi:hypothetical protein